MSSSDSPRFPGIDHLTLHDLECWAGSTILSRGRDYQRSRRVLNLAITPDDMLVADVRGTELYAVVVLADEDGRLDSFCSCPCDFTCKHAVAVLLEYLDRLNKGQSVPLAAPDDPRLLLLEDADEDDAWAYSDLDAGYADDDEDEEDEDDEDADDGAFVGSGQGRGVGKRGGKTTQELAAQLADLSREQLIRLIVDLAEDGPDLRRRLEEALYTLRGDTGNLLKALRREIEAQAAVDPWDGEGEPDYTGVCRLMQALLAAGRYDELLEAGEELIRLGGEQLEHSDDDGEITGELIECVELLLPALRGSSRPLEDRLLWTLDLVLADEYGIGHDLCRFLEEQHPAEAWRRVAEVLQARLREMSVGQGYSGAYRRRQVSDWLIHALEGAGLDAAILPLCEAEARLNGDYARLIDRLMAAGRDEAALGWIREGMEAARNQGHSGTLSQLLDRERAIHRKLGDRQSLVRLEAAEFVRVPCAAAFVRCREALALEQGAGDIWPGLRRALLNFLVSGTLPWDQADWPKALGCPDADRAKGDRPLEFPQVRVLLDIALEEKNPEDVVHWHALLPKIALANDELQDRVATALQQRFPDQSLAIWKDLAEGNIALTKRTAYQTAAAYLRKARQVLGKERRAEWTSYVQTLRQQNARKRLFLEILDGLEDRPLLKKK